MQTFFVTFSQRYRREEHPLFPDIDPDGYLTVKADSLEDALVKAHRHLNAYFSHVYPADEFESSFYPLGELWTLN